MNLGMPGHEGVSRVCLVSVQSCPRGLGISLDQRLPSFWLVPRASSIAQVETPGTPGKADRKA